MLPEHKKTQNRNCMRAAYANPDTATLQEANPVTLMGVSVSGVSHGARAGVHVVGCGRQQAAACSCAGSCARLLVVRNLVQRRGVVCRARQRLFFRIYGLSQAYGNLGQSKGGLVCPSLI